MQSTATDSQIDRNNIRKKFYCFKFTNFLLFRMKYVINWRCLFDCGHKKLLYYPNARINYLFIADLLMSFLSIN